MPARSLRVPVIIVAIAAVAIAFVLFNNREPDQAPEATDSFAASVEPGIVYEVIEPNVPDRLNVERHDESDPLAMGPVDAPVTVVAYSDFQCAFCALWSHQTLPELLPMVEDGQLRIEWRDIAVFGPDSSRAAYAAYAAGLQGQHYEFSVALFDGGNTPSPAELTDEALAGLAHELGLDVEKFNADRTSQEVEQAMAETYAEGEENGVFSTPWFLINGSPVIGAQPTDKFLETIDAEREAAARG